jgi:hypothetical protein
MARRGAASASALLGLVSALTAQVEPPPAGAIRGVIRGEMSRLLPDAEIFLDSVPAGTRNAANGTFRFTQVAEGQHWLFVRRIGYAPTRRLLSVVSGQELAVDVRLEPLPFNLPGIEVVARSGYRDFDQFTQRTRNAWGHSVSEAQIRGLGDMRLSVLVRSRLPGQATSWFDQARRDVVGLGDTFERQVAFGFHQRWGPPPVPYGRLGSGGYPTDGWYGTTAPLTGSDRLSRRPGSYGMGGGSFAFPAPMPGGGGFGTGCAPAVSINGNTPSVGTNLDDIDPDLVASMEIYESKRRGGRVPADFAEDAWVATCGLVVVWSR